jgi:hypothetical protein
MTFPSYRAFVPVILTVTSLALLTVVSVRAFNPQPDPPAVFGMVGITYSETARLSAVVRAGSAVLTAPTACRVAFSFVAADGRVLKQEIKAILPGHAAFVDLTGAEAALPPGPISLRTGIRPVVEVAAAQSSADICHAAAGFEQYENITGRTTFFVMAPPVPDRSITATAGISAGQ